MIPNVVRVAAVALVPLLVACASPSVAPTPAPGADEVVVEGPPPGPSAPWETLSRADRKKHMIREVLPRMRKKFQAFDPVRYADFGCQTCHGEDRQDVDFQMPNKLPKLYPTGSPEQKRVVEEKLEIARFMFNEVVPTMRALLGAAEYDPETKTGFTCYVCHPTGVSGDGGG